MKFRKERMAKQIQQQVDQWFRSSVELRSIPNVTLTDLSISDDLSYIKLYVYADLLPSAERVDMLRALNQLIHQFKKQIRDQLKLRRIPKFKFYYDDQEVQRRALMSVLNNLDTCSVESE
ncbi:MAG: hypothetical protein CMF51_04235 [Legionellales bacterium]|nr:hypothetical protein [Legionellales bacterium]|tara:strand:+ start:381 stop:740 length:360 start_codon:yes stop_codon:yes gene_type:complete